MLRRIRQAWYAHVGNAQQLLVALVFLPLFSGIYYGAYYARFDGALDAPTKAIFMQTVAAVCLLKLVACMAWRLHQSWTRFVTFHDAVVLTQAATCASVGIALVDYLAWPQLVIPRSVFLLDWSGTIVVLGGMRALIRWQEEIVRGNAVRPGDTPVLIVGANNNGESLLRTMRRSGSPYRVVGFIADDSQELYQRIGGVPVLGTRDQTASVALTHGAREILITAGSLPGKDVRRLMEDTERHGLAVKVLPSCEQLLSGSVDLLPRTVSIEDLLRREPVILNFEELHQWIDGKVLLVTGSAGSIGSEIARQLLKFRPRLVVLVDRSENGLFFLQRELDDPALAVVCCVADVADEPRMEALFRGYQPQIVFHAAAYKHVPMMEQHPGEAIKNIVVATQCVADLAERFNAESFVLISTDKAVNPTSVMGVCKRVAELYVQAQRCEVSCRFVTVRFGNVLDSAGSVVPIFRDQILKGGPVTVTHPAMTRYFMTIPEASRLVIQAGAMGHGGEIFVLDMGEPVRIVDLAEDLIRLSGLRVGDDIEIVFTGLRPGEKLYEELHHRDERRLPTEHPKILIAASRPRDRAAVTAAIQRLRQTTDEDLAAILAELARVVPEYRSEQTERTRYAA